ncbi:MAG TPA: FlgT C-terminal domain-containing protein, partial [Candidatus Obscuribacterales bacterium]
VVDINTGEILAAVHGAGESKRSGMSLGIVAGADWGSSEFATSIAGEATLAAVNQVCTQLKDLSAKIPDNQSLAAANVQGKIADVTGTTVIVNVGKVNGLQVGDHLQAERPYKTVKDPTTGKVLKELSSTVGVIKLTQVDPDSATGDIVKGSGLKVGDTVRKVTTSVEAVVLTPLPGSTPAAGTASKPPVIPAVKTK